MIARSWPIRTLILFIMVLFGQSASAEDVAEIGWVFGATPYLWVPSISSEVEIRGVATGRDVDSESTTDFGDILKDVDFGFLGHLEAQKSRYALFSDLIYLRISTDLVTEAFSVGLISVSPFEIDLDIEATVFELGGGYQIWRGRAGNLAPDRLANVEIIAGVRYTAVEFDSTLKTTFSGPLGIFSRQVSAAVGFSVDLFDPIIGARATLPVGEDWTIKLRGDIGGFGVGSDLTWNAGLGLTYQAWEQTSLLFGYRVLAYHLEVDQPRTSINLDLIFHGPIIAVTFSW